MCGICGIVLREGVKDGERRIDDMRAAMSHRGPDGDGFANPSIVPQVLLGHVRLSIIAPGEGASQPMVDGETGNVITFNGEIYNYRDLRQELIGHAWFQAPDCDGSVHIAFGDARVGDVVTCKLVDSFCYELVGEIINNDEG